jgi:hypothetical protein
MSYKIEVYRKISDKDKFFNQTLINTRKEFDHVYASLKKDHSIWRGAIEAKHKIYSSLQRFWISNNLEKGDRKPLDYIKQTIKDAEEWNKGLLGRYFKNFNTSEPTVFAILSILRHYGAPSPLIDFTRDPRIALFFAADSSDITNNNSDIDCYFSVYQIEHGHYINQNNLKNTYWNYWPTTESYKEQLEEYCSKHPYKDKSKCIEEFRVLFCQGWLVNKDNVYTKFEDPTMPSHLINDDENDSLKYFINTNYNIVNQDGVFIINLHETSPLEETISNRITKIGKETGVPSREINAAINSQAKLFKCYNIHKSLKAYILRSLLNEGINRTYIYPDMQSMAEFCQRKFMENI